jgi:FAD-dependent oxidoreductase domain-containing protein 1
LGVKDSKDCDVVIVGAGIVGLASAYHILNQDPSCKVVVVEKALSPGQGDTAKSVAGVRNTFTSEVNRLLSETSIDFYRHLQSDLGFNVHLEFVGYLWLLTTQLLEHLEPVIHQMKKDGVELELWEGEQLSRMLPNTRLRIDANDREAQMMGLSSIVKGLQGVKCGTVGPEKIIEFYERQVREMGGILRYGERARSMILEPHRKLGLPCEPLVWQDAEVKGVVTDHGDIRAEQTVVAAGAWSTELLDTIGVDSHIRAKKRQVFAVKGTDINGLLYSKGFNEHGVLPLTIVPPCLVYMKPNGASGSFWVGVSDYLGRHFTFDEEPMPEDSFYTYNIHPILSHYFPCFKNIRPFNKWAGHYDMNTIDANPYVFEESGLIVAAGASGSGVMKADAIGRIVAASQARKDFATLCGGKQFKVARLGVQTREVEPELFVI